MTDEPDDFRKILIPMIRRILPSLVASEIVGVQPMTILGFFKDEVETEFDIVHTAIRPFMREGDAEPNEHYRPWIEEHIGVQGKDWNWEIHSVLGNSIAIHFANTEHASLFQLTWP